MSSHLIHRVTLLERIGAHALRVEFADGSEQTIDFTPSATLDWVIGFKNPMAKR